MSEPSLLNRPTVAVVVLPFPTVPGYEILGELGRGGMGVVYKALQIALNRTVALKMVLDGARAGARELARFRAEAVAVARLAHPNIVQVYEVGEHEGLPFFSLEYVDGGSLADRLDGTPWQAGPAAALVEQLARAVHHAHERGVVHRDLKPANVLLGIADLKSAISNLQSAIKITDFGLAKQLDRSVAHTRSGAAVGTPCYMAPEQAVGNSKAVGPRTDVWALGTILYELLTGRPPFQGQNAMDTMLRVAREDPVPPGRLNAHVARSLETICLKCLEKPPGRRYASAEALAEDLQRYRKGTTVRARPAGAWRKGSNWLRRHPVKAVLLVVVLSASLGSVAGLFLHQRQAWQRQLKEQQACADLRVRVQAEIRAGRDAVVRDDRAAARAALVRAQFLAADEPTVADLKAEAAEQLTLLDRHDAARKARDQAAARHRQFLRLRDEAVFHATLASGVDGPKHREQTLGAARQALALFHVTSGSPARLIPDSSLTEEEQVQVRDACYELLLVLAGAEAQPQPGQGTDREHAKARRALHLLDRAAALGVPDHPTQAYYLHRARYLEQLGDTAGAARERARTPTQPKTALDFYLVGDDYYRHSDLARAKNAFEAALTCQPGHFWARYRQAVCQLCLQKPEPAKAALTACLEKRPDFLWAYLLRGFAHGQLDEFDASEADYAHSLTLNPDADGRYVLFANRGALRERRGWLDRAVEDLEACVALKPEKYQAYAGLAQVHERRKEFAQAVARLDQAIAREPGLASLYRWRARLRVDALNQPGAALRDLDRAIHLDQAGNQVADLARDHAERGRVLQREHRYEEALAAYGQATSLEPRYAKAHLGRARALLPLRRYGAAEAALDRYLDSGGKPLAEVYRTRALVHTRLRKFPEAVVDYTEALKFKPDPALYTGRGWARLGCREPERARDDFEAALRLRPQSIEAYLGRGAALVQMEQYRAGVADIEEALHHAPVTPRQRWRAACVYAQVVGHIDAARPGLDRSIRNLCRQYQDRALDLLDQALAALSAFERGPFWREYVQEDAAFAVLRRSPRYGQMEARYAPPTVTAARRK